MSKILLVEELRERERLSLTLLRNALAAKGHDVKIAPLKRLVAEYVQFKPHAIVSNAVTTLAGFVGNYLFLDRDTRIINFHWEQILNPHSFLRFKFSPIVAERLVDGRVSWGPAFKRALVALNPTMDPGRIGVVGSIKNSEGRFVQRVSRHDLAKLYNIDLRRFSGVVLCPTSFGVTSFTRAAVLSMKSTNPFIEQYFEQHKRVKEEFLAALRTLALGHPNILFMLRAHPTRESSYYASYNQKGFPENVVLNAGGPISAAIALADLVLTSNSTVLIDAYLQNKPAINLRLDDDCYKELGLLHQCEDAFGHQLAFSAVPDTRLEKYFGHAMRTRDLDRVAASWLGDVSDRVPERLASFIEETIRREPVSKRIRLSDVDSVLVLRKVVSNASERTLQHRRFRPIGAASPQDFDFDSLLERIADACSRPVEPAPEVVAI